MKYAEWPTASTVPWLKNTTVKESIVGESGPVDETWHHTVLTCCALDEDTASFPGGDAWVGQLWGIALSGGQKQRIVSNSFGFPSSNNYRL